MSTQEHEAAAVIQLMRVHNRQTVCNCVTSAGPDDGMCSFCQVTARGFAAALADAVRLANEERDRALDIMAQYAKERVRTADAVRVARADEREAGAKEICNLCREGEYPVRPGKYRPNEWWHDVGGAQIVCKAAALRARVVEGDATAKPTNRWGIQPDGDIVDLRGKMSGGLSLPVKREGDATPGPEPEATHRCKLCNAHWRLNPPTKEQPDGSWSLVYPYNAGKCCDNVAMGDQIEPLVWPQPPPSEER